MFLAGSHHCLCTMKSSSGRQCQITSPEVKRIMLTLAEHEIFLAHNCLNANNGWQFNIYEQENSIQGLSGPEKS